MNAKTQEAIRLLNGVKCRASMEAARLGGDVLLGWVECQVDDDAPQLHPLLTADVNWNEIAWIHGGQRV